MVIILICIIILITSCIFFYKAKKLVVYKDNTAQENLKKKIKELELITNQKEQKVFELIDQSAQAQNKINQLYEKHNSLQKQLQREAENKRSNLQDLYKEIQDSQLQKYYSYELTVENAYKLTEQRINQEVKELEVRREQALTELNQIKASLSAAAAASLRKQEEATKIYFYQIQIPDKNLQDIQKIEHFKSELYDPTIASKIIWSGYIMKATTAMCNRVLGTSTICGIYKITNTITDQIYIGQSVDIASRWKQHVKCGLGIDAPSTNKLYNAMQKEGVWNFSFELMESCDRAKLNERERFWIDMYQSDKFGYNSNSGVKK